MKTTIIPFAIVTLLLMSCNNKTDVTVEDSSSLNDSTITLLPDEAAAFAIETGKPEKKVMSSIIRVNGMMDVPPQNLVTISAPMGGFVVNTHLLQGMKVRKGESLIELQDIQYIQLQQDYLDLRSKLDYAEVEYNRQIELAKENVNAQKSLQQAKSSYESLHAQVEGLKAKLRIINIDSERIKTGSIQRTIRLYSPINGYVTEVNVNLGQHVNANNALIKIVDTEHLHVELYVFEQDLSKLAIDQQVFFTLINDSKQRGAKIHLIGREIGADRTVRIHCHLDEEDSNLLPGMYVNATIETNPQELTVLPDEAIVPFEGKSYVFIAESNNTFVMNPILTGISQQGYTEIKVPSLLNENSLVVTNGAFQLLSKLKNTEEE